MLGRTGWGLTIADDLVARLALDMAGKKRQRRSSTVAEVLATHAANPTPQASFSSSGSYRPCLTGRAPAHDRFSGVF